MEMRNWFREGFYAGAAVALLLGIFLMWLWGAEHQIRQHTDNLLHAIEKKDWDGFAAFVSSITRISGEMIVPCCSKGRLRSSAICAAFA